ncbi:adrenodoxin, mitochondrial isoform X2 [Ochotona princeps]|uniref:adrenodoxin, mitochondrial isoform X2 n=1 Tax=Ochotona princeps TaxID=9978 RepID=UPI0027150A38|nr:adrenodoxin, mitochondrial isoform X2 [Ochotona princeps]
MAAAGCTRLLRAVSAPLGGPARRWLLLAGSRAGAGGLPGSRGPGSSAEAGLGGGRAGARRPLSQSAPARSSSEDKVTVNFINRDGETLTAKGKVGDSLLDVVIENNLDIDGFGACEGTLACSTCHLIFEEHIYDKLQPVTDEENDMLDLAYGLTDRSRLGCQICLTKSMDNMTVRVPDAVSDARQSVDMGKNS